MTTHRSMARAGANHVIPCELPPTALLLGEQAAGAFTDCYCIRVAAAITQAEFVEAFYTTRLFGLERWLIGAVASRPSTDRQARELAQGQRDDFAAWNVAARLPDQLLLADQTGRTRSWLMAQPVDAAESPRATRLYFGSALVPRIDRQTGRRRFGLLFHALLGFHRAYSQALLHAAARKLSRRPTLAPTP